MKRLMILAVLLAFPLLAQAADYSKLRADKSTLTFVSKQMGVQVEGAFRKFSASVKLNPARVEAGKARVEIELDSIDAGGAEANDEVKGKSWFDVAAFPRAVFELTSVQALGNGNYEAAGKLTLKGKTAALKIPFSLKEEKGTLLLDGSFVLKRLEFAIGSGLWGDTSVVADEVQVKFHLVLQ